VRRIVFDDYERVGRWTFARTGGSWGDPDAVAIGLENDGKLVVGVVLDHYNGVSIALHIAIADGAFLGRDFIRFVFGYAFGQLRTKKAIAFIDSGNSKSLTLARKLGFVDEAIIKDASPGGDLIFLTMAAQQCHWLKGPRHGQVLKQSCIA
jgi:RimJ/RimL family protein N-acetyltransferase